MSTRAQACAWFVLVAAVTPVAARAQERTEQELLNLIVTEGPAARAIRAGVEVTRLEQRARLARPNPTVSYSREGAGFTEFLQAEQFVPLFGVRGALARAGVAATSAAEAERDARLWQLRAEASAAIARLAVEQRRVELANAHSADIQKLIEILGTREREGEGSRFDRLRAEQELREARLSETAAAIAVADARALVAAMLPTGASVGVLRSSPSAATAPALDVLVTRARASRAELRALTLSAEVASHEADAARLSRRPSPTVFGGLKRADDAGERTAGGIFGLTITIPLFDNGSRDAARWHAERARVEAEHDAIQQQIEFEIGAAREALALRSAAVAQDQEGAADELIRIADVAYREGEAGILDLLDAYRTAFRARMRSLDLRLDVRLAQIALERAVGDSLWP